MESQKLRKKSYVESNEVARSPTLQTVLMVEKFIDDNSGEYKKTGVFNNLPKKVMWQTYLVILDYLQSINKIAIDGEGVIIYLWNPKLAKLIANRKRY